MNYKNNGNLPTKALITAIVFQTIELVCKFIILQIVAFVKVFS